MIVFCSFLLISNFLPVLNLTYPDKSEIKFKISQFPDGQQDLTITEIKYKVGSWTHLCRKSNAEEIEIRSRFNSFNQRFYQ